VTTIFDFIWGQGKDCQDDKEFALLVNGLGIENAEELISAPEVKSRLRDNTDKAIAEGVYGVPTFVAGGHLFWGQDNTDMFIEYLQKPEIMDTPNIQRLRDLPTGASR
ncbi:MAG: DsbA family protein, partial [Pseudomonadota bacterium]|nr:DsbA family protein [Pseudomonadota bacterium]